MFTSFLKVFFKTFIRHRLFSLINIGGLAIGLACCLMIALFVQNELGYDRQYANANSIFLVDQVIPNRNDGAASQHLSSGLLAPQLQQDYPDTVATGRYVPSVPARSPVQLESETAEASEASVRFADAAFLRVFDFVWLEGSPDSALRTPAEIVLTRELAEKYFGRTDVVGRTLRVNAEMDAQVTGVIEKPTLTTLDFNALLTIDYHEQLMRNRGLDPKAWYTNLYQTYVLLRGSGERQSMENSLPAFVERYIPRPRESGALSLELLPLKDLYLAQSSGALGNLDRVLIFVAVAAIILLIAVVNFMNLGTSRASMRGREVGLRLALGSARAELVRHFLAEAMLMTALAMLLALVVVELMTPFVNSLLGLKLELFAIPLTLLVPGLLLATVVVGLLAGLYPAFYMSRAQPSRVLHGQLTRGPRGQRLRALLVVGQFTFSIAFIIAALVMFSQLRFVRELNLGFSPDRKVLIALPDKRNFDINRQWNSLQDQLRQLPGVSSISYALDSPLLSARFVSAIEGPDAEKINIDVIPTAADYLPQYGIDLLAGRYLVTDSGVDEVALQNPDETVATNGSYVLNESAVRALGLSPQDAIGQVFRVPLGRRGAMNATVVGVVENTVSSAFTESDPALYYVPEVIDFFFVNGTLTIDVESASLVAFNTALPQAWKSYFPNAPLQRRYLDEEVQGLYQKEQQQTVAIGHAALVAVLIACFGLLGLAAFNAELRRKEIGIRKVVGGSVWRIVLLLTSDFSKLVLLANVIAWPLAYVAMERWLENFAYRIDLTPLVFIGSGLIALCIAWVTVGGTAAKAASEKPVLALRYE